MVVLDKTGLIAEVQLTGRDTDEQIGTGFVERTRSGYVIVHVDLSTIPEAAYTGFHIGPIAVTEDKESTI